jgi:hypothetical protein
MLLMTSICPVSVRRERRLRPTKHRHEYSRWQSPLATVETAPLADERLSLALLAVTGAGVMPVRVALRAMEHSQGAE